MIYKKMYQVAAEKLVKHNIAYHAIALYAHDSEAINAMFTYGFGLRILSFVVKLKQKDSIFNYIKLMKGCH
jgi:hypothetical protein